MTLHQHTIKTKIPNELIYELDNGQPIYYKGYKQVLSGEKTFEEIMGSSSLQSLIISKILRFLYTTLNEKYEILPNELGILLGNKSNRSLDIAIVEKATFKTFDNKYTKTSPKIVIEIDTKADISDIGNFYFSKKTEDLLNFGVEKVVWIYTNSKKITLSEKGKETKSYNWNDTFKILDDVNFCLEDLVK